MMRCALLGLGCWLLAAAAEGQSYHGGVRGLVNDQDGIVPGVDVTLTNEQTNISRSTLTNEHGEYAFTSVDPGTYRVSAVLQGFKTIARSSVRVGTQEFLVIDFTLEVGTIEQTVTVTGRAPAIDRATASQGAALDAVALQALPTVNRGAFALGASVPTVILSSPVQFTRQQDQSSSTRISFGGGPVRMNSYTLDGVPITDISNRAVASPTIEALGDVKVQVRTYDVEVDRTGGGVFNATTKSGTNVFRGTALFQVRPVWGSVNNYFSQRAFETNGNPANAKPDAVYYLGGGGFGGPITKDRTFFWIAGEDYHDVVATTASTTFPTAAERAGDFSKLINGSGASVTIYDPLTRLPFPGNIIPASRINPVSAAIARYFPLPQTDVDTGLTNYTVAAPITDEFQQQYTAKIEHKFTDRVSLTGFYLYNRTDEPCTNYFEPGGKGAHRFADPSNSILKRRPQILAVNNRWVLGNRSLVTLRLGWSRFPDYNPLTIAFDPASLQTSGTGFSQSFLNQVEQAGSPKFPNGAIAGYSGFGAVIPAFRTWTSWGPTGSYSRLIGAHTVKAGANYRRIGVYLFSPGNSAGLFTFDREFTSSTGMNNNSTTEGNGFATFLLGYPSGNSTRQSTMTLSTPLDVYTKYYGGYLQDDWRVSSKLTVTYGVRLEHEDGIRERHNNITVGFDPSASNALSSITIPATVDPTGNTAARNVTGGLMYAGVDGNRVFQGDPPGLGFSPRVGVVHSIDSKTVVRGGYGSYLAPWTYPTPMANNNYGQVGFTNITVSPQTTGTPNVTLTDPFPNGALVPPLGNARRTLTGVGTSISFVDQHRTAARVQQYSADVQRDVGRGMAVSVGYIGARGDHLPLGGTNDNTVVNINQLDPKYLALGSAVLLEQVANPFFGHPEFAGTGLGGSLTIARNQLLRPYPQFLNVMARQVSEGISRYNALVVEWTRRSSRGLSGRVSYTYSVLKDNQIGEVNFYTANGLAAPMNNYNYIAGLPACTTTNFAACYNPRADYATGIIDVPHRVIIAPIWILPSPSGNGLVARLLGNWAAAAVINLQSGYPIGVLQGSDGLLLGSGQRPNVVPGVDRATPGSLADRLASADHSAAAWLNPKAFSAAPAGTWGNAPRVVTDARSPKPILTDISVSRNVSVGGAREAQVKVEVFNLFNRVQTLGFASVSAGSAAFGQINAMQGFMRTTQIMFRYSW
jgi:trimeric autotransporter adhesin